MMDLRLQAPDGASTLSLDGATATMGELRAAIAARHAIPAAEQQLLAGFPPVPLASEDSALLSHVFDGAQGGMRVLVRRVAPAAAASSSSGGGRRKPQQVRRLPADGAAPPRDEQPAPPVGGEAPVGVAAPEGAAAGDEEAGDDDEQAPSGASGKKKKKKEPDPLALTMEAEAKRQKAAGGGGGGGGGGSSSAGSSGGGVKMKGLSPEQLALEYFHSSGSAVSATVKGGGGSSGDFLSEHGMIEHRVTAIGSRKYTLEEHPPVGKGKTACPTLSASFRAVRRDVCEVVQFFSRDELAAFLHALSSRGSSRRGGSNSHLLTVEAMAARSPAVLWSFVHAFDGDVAGGVAQLKAA